MTTETFQPPESVSGLQRLGMVAAVVGLVLAGVGFALGGLERFYQAYLVAYTFWLGVVLGSMALLMVQHLTGGAWGVVIRRPLEAAVSTLPVMALLFLPIVPGMHDLYHWTHPEALSDPVIAAKAAYLNTPFFLVRAAFYFAVWIGRPVVTNSRVRASRMSACSASTSGVLMGRSALQSMMKLAPEPPEESERGTNNS